MTLPVTSAMFTNLKIEDGQYKFTVAPINVSYVNTLRRIILTGIKTFGIRSDMISTGDKAGTTSDVTILHNDTPMTNEMLADRVGLIPIHVPAEYISGWRNETNKDTYEFVLDVEGDVNESTIVTASDFVIYKMEESKHDDSVKELQKTTLSSSFFVPNKITKSTSLIAILQPSQPPQKINIIAKMSTGTGREHARFSPVSQCSYEYSLDTNEERVDQMFVSWLSISKKIDNIDKDSDKYMQLWREFNTMQIKRCFLVNEKQEPYSFDFTIESLGTLPVEYIVENACEVGENMCNRYVNIDTDELDAYITITPASNKVNGFDFRIRGQDHTFGNLIQTWLVENHIEGTAEPQITYAGYSVPHPLREEIILRIGVDIAPDDTEQTMENRARKALAEAARGCGAMFAQLRQNWKKLNWSVSNSNKFQRGAPNITRAATAATAAPVRVTKLG